MLQKNVLRTFEIFRYVANCNVANFPEKKKCKKHVANITGNTEMLQTPNVAKKTMPQPQDTNPTYCVGRRNHCEFTEIKVPILQHHFKRETSKEIISTPDKSHGQQNYSRKILTFKE